MSKKQPASATKNLLQVSLAPFWKRLAAWIYDLLGGLAVFILALSVGLLIAYLVTLPWAENGAAVSSALSNNPLWLIYILACVQYYYVWCWVKGGQTVGMRAWNLKICRPNGEHLSWKEAYIRSIASIGGLGTLWCLIDKEKRGLQDLSCDSRVIVLPKGYGKEQKPLI
ncbi:RDD family protein [Aliikangiella coralliicola]|uniref:RDD family protein n=1 Tax=Aliikangiella coralliicola TaxID=2592383 RepID=A0A545UAR9_9GAMM|nr:RDD family protein [Aliikangiella coralliicola]TQV86564.1 RDD family protein [Aliikangiella coralliicola]